MRSVAPEHNWPPARRPAVTRADARADERRRIVAQAAQAAADELPALADTSEADGLTLPERALAVCRALCAAEYQSDEWFAALAEVWAIDEEAGR